MNTVSYHTIPYHTIPMCYYDLSHLQKAPVARFPRCADVYFFIVLLVRVSGCRELRWEEVSFALCFLLVRMMMMMMMR